MRHKWWRGNGKVFDGTLETTDSCRDAYSSICSCHVCFRSVVKLSIVCVLSANAIACFSLELFLRNSFGACESQVSLLMPFYSCPTSSVSFQCNYDPLDLNYWPVKTTAIYKYIRKRSYEISFLLASFFFKCIVFNMKQHRKYRSLTEHLRHYFDDISKAFWITCGFKVVIN